MSPQFTYSDLLPIGQDTTKYRLLTKEGVSVQKHGDLEFLHVEPSALSQLSEVAIHDISHYLRAAHLQQLANILSDPEASPNDRFVATDLLKNANISAGGILPMCQDTGTALIMGKKGQHVLTSSKDEVALSQGIYDAYTKLNLRYSQMAPVTTWEEKNTGNNLPAQVEIYSDSDHSDEYNFLFIAKGGGSANKSFLYQETKAVLNPTSFMRNFARSEQLHVLRITLQLLSVEQVLSTQLRQPNWHQQSI
jgi:fumarate hydratase, class I